MPWWEDSLKSLQNKHLGVLAALAKTPGSCHLRTLVQKYPPFWTNMGQAGLAGEVGTITQLIVPQDFTGCNPAWHHRCLTPHR